MASDRRSCGLCYGLGMTRWWRDGPWIRCFLCRGTGKERTFAEVVHDA